MAVCAGLGAHWLYVLASLPLKRILRMGGGGIALLILAVYVLGGAYHYRYAYFLLSGKWSHQKYLASLERTTGVAQWINENLPQSAKVLIESETRLFYFDRPVVRREMFEWVAPSPGTKPDPGTRIKLFADHGITHILSSDLIRDGKIIQETSSIGKELFAAGFAKEIYTAGSQNIRENRYFYRLFEIRKTGDAPFYRHS
jgi:hypothetical protein